MYRIEHEWCGDTHWKVTWESNDKVKLIGRCKSRMEANQLISRDMKFNRRNSNEDKQNQPS